MRGGCQSPLQTPALSWPFLWEGSARDSAGAYRTLIGPLPDPEPQAPLYHQAGSQFITAVSSQTKWKQTQQLAALKSPIDFH